MREFAAAVPSSIKEVGGALVREALEAFSAKRLYDEYMNSALEPARRAERQFAEMANAAVSTQAGAAAAERYLAEQHELQMRVASAFGPTLDFARHVAARYEHLAAEVTAIDKYVAQSLLAGIPNPYGELSRTIASDMQNGLAFGLVEQLTSIYGGYAEDLLRYGYGATQAWVNVNGRFEALRAYAEEVGDDADNHADAVVDSGCEDDVREVFDIDETPVEENDPAVFYVLAKYASVKVKILQIARRLSLDAIAIEPDSMGWGFARSMIVSICARHGGRAAELALTCEMATLAIGTFFNWQTRGTVERAQFALDALELILDELLPEYEGRA